MCVKYDDSDCLARGREKNAKTIEDRFHRSGDPT